VALPRTTPPELDVTAPPSHPLPTPAPLPAATAPAPRRGLKRLGWLVGLVVLGTAAAAAAFLIRPGNEGATPTPTATASVPAAQRPPQSYPTDAFDLTLPAEWRARCLEAQGKCADEPLGEGQIRSAFAKEGPTSETITIDRTRLPEGAAPVSLESAIGRVDEALTALPGYTKADGSPRPFKSGEREAMEHSFTSQDPQRRAGTVFVFKHDQDVYVITGAGPDPASAKNAADLALAGLEPR
jgi:hypothetical protein